MLTQVPRSTSGSFNPNRSARGKPAHRPARLSPTPPPVRGPPTSTPTPVQESPTSNRFEVTPDRGHPRSRPTPDRGRRPFEADAHQGFHLRERGGRRAVVGARPTPDRGRRPFEADAHQGFHPRERGGRRAVVGVWGAASWGWFGGGRVRDGGRSRGGWAPVGPPCVEGLFALHAWRSPPAATVAGLGAKGSSFRRAFLTAGGLSHRDVCR